MVREAIARLLGFRMSVFFFCLILFFRIFFETETKDLPHPLNKRRIEFDKLQVILQKNRMAITLVQQYALVS